MLPANPFPGLDPWMQRRWGAARLSLAVNGSGQLQDRLPDDLIACSDRRTVFAEAADWLNWAGGPLFPAARAPRDERGPARVTIRPVEALNAGREDAVTVIEFLGPDDKLTRRGRDAYDRNRRGWRLASVNLVEIDLTRGGRRPFEDGPPDLNEANHAISVHRTGDRRAAVTTHSLRDPLPEVRVPLRETDDDVILELQPVVDRVFLGGGAHKLNHAAALDPPLSPDDAAWAAGLLESGRRESETRPGEDR